MTTNTTITVKLRDDLSTEQRADIDRLLAEVSRVVTVVRETQL